MVVTPSLVTVVPASTAKFAAEERAIGLCAARASWRARIAARARPSSHRRTGKFLFLFTEGFVITRFSIMRAVIADSLSGRRGVGEAIRSGIWRYCRQVGPIDQIGADLQSEKKVWGVGNNEGHGAIRGASGWAEAQRHRQSIANAVAIQVNLVILRQGPAFHRRSGLHRDGDLRHNGSFENGGRANRRRTADLPKDIGGLRAADQNHVARGGDKGGTCLENPNPIRVILTVQG